MLISLLLLVWYVVLLTVVVATLYTLGTYLIRRYDGRLAREGLLKPDYLDRKAMPQGFTKWQGIGREIVSVFTTIWLYPLGMMGSRSLPGSIKEGNGAPILLIHGFFHNRSAWFWMKRRLVKGGLGPIYSCNLPSKKGTVEGCAEVVLEEAKRIAKECGTQKLILVGHSMGGLVASYYAEHLAPPASVTHVIALGAPFHGTRTSVLTPSPATRQMCINSPFTTELRDAMMANGYTVYFLLATRLDNLILPYQSSLLGKSEENECIFTAKGHLSLLYSKAVACKIIDWLRVPAEKETPKIKKPTRARRVKIQKTPAHAQRKGKLFTELG